MKTVFAALLVACAIAAPGSAQEATYDCTLKNNESYGFISPRMIVSVNPDRNAAAVFDAFIQLQHEVPIPVDFQATNKGVYRLSWKLSAIPINNQTIKGSWTVTLNPRTKKIRAFAILNGYDNRPSGQGTCKVAKGSLLGS